MIDALTMNQRLKPGMKFSYGELCKALNEEVKLGNSQVAQLKKWAQYINFTRNGRVYTILDVYTRPHIDYSKIPVHSKPAHNSKTAKLYAYLLQDHLKDQIYKENIFYSSQLYQGLGLLKANINYDKDLKHKLLCGYGNPEEINKVYSDVCTELRLSCKYKYDNFKATSWFKNYFMSDIVYCGIREGGSELFDIRSEAPSTFKWIQQAYAVQNILSELPKKEGFVDFESIDMALPSTKSFARFLAQSLHLSTCFIGMRIWQIRDLPVCPEWDAEKARRAIRDYAVASHEKLLNQKFSSLDSRRIKDFVCGIMPPVLDAEGSDGSDGFNKIWIDLYESSNFTENCRWE